MAKSLVNMRDNGYMRTRERDSFTLQAKMRRAKAEIDLYTLAIHNTHEFNFSDNSAYRLITYFLSLLMPSRLLNVFF